MNILTNWHRTKCSTPGPSTCTLNCTCVTLFETHKTPYYLLSLTHPSWPVYPPRPSDSGIGGGARVRCLVRLSPSLHCVHGKGWLDRRCRHHGRWLGRWRAGQDRRPPRWSDHSDGHCRGLRRHTSNLSLQRTYHRIPGSLQNPRSRALKKERSVCQRHSTGVASQFLGSVLRSWQLRHQSSRTKIGNAKKKRIELEHFNFLLRLNKPCKSCWHSTGRRIVAWDIDASETLKLIIDPYLRLRPHSLLLRKRNYFNMA